MRSPETLRPQIDLQRILQLHQRDEVRPPLSAEQRQHRRMLQVSIACHLPDRPVAERRIEVSRDLLRDRGGPAGVAMRPLPGDQLVPGSSDNTAAAWHPTATLRPSHPASSDLQLTWSFIHTTLPEHTFDYAARTGREGAWR